MTATYPPTRERRESACSSRSLNSVRLGRPVRGSWVAWWRIASSARVRTIADSRTPATPSTNCSSSRSTGSLVPTSITASGPAGSPTGTRSTTGALTGVGPSVAALAGSGLSVMRLGVVEPGRLEHAGDVAVERVQDTADRGDGRLDHDVERRLRAGRPGRARRSPRGARAGARRSVTSRALITSPCTASSSRRLVATPSSQCQRPSLCWTRIENSAVLRGDPTVATSPVCSSARSSGCTSVPDSGPSSISGSYPSTSAHDGLA